MFRLDIFDKDRDALFSVVLDVTLPDDLGSVSGGGSEYSLKIPLTNNNRAFFEDWQRPASYAPDAPALKDFQLTYGGASCRKGKILIKNSDQTSINVILLFDNQNILQQLKGVLVRELEWSNVTVSGVSGPSDWNTLNELYDACWFPVKWRKWTTGTYSYVTEADAWIGFKVVSMFRYAMRRVTPMPEIVSSIVDDSTDNNFFKYLILGINPNAGYDENYFRDILGLRASHNSGLITYSAIPAFPAVQQFTQLTNVTDPGNFNNAGAYDTGTQVYTAPISASYNFRIVMGYNNWDYDPPTWGLRASLPACYYRVNGGAWNSFSPTFGYFIQPGAYVEFVANPTLSAGDTVEFGFNTAGAVATYSFRMNQCYLEVFKAQTYLPGEPIVPQGMIPEGLTVLDAIRGVMNAFNLRMYYYEATNQVFIEPEHIWQQQDGTQTDGFVNEEIDWTDRIDIGREIKVEPTREMLDVTFEYDEAADLTLKTLDEQRELTAAAARYNAGRSDAERKIIRLPFTKLNHILDVTVTPEVLGGTGERYPTAIMPLFYPVIHNDDPDTDQTFTDQVVFLACASFYRDNDLPDTNAVVRVADVLQGGDRYIIACAFNYSYNFLTGDDNLPTAFRWPNLEYGDNTAPDGTPQVGLVKRFWLPTLASLRKGKRLTVPLKSSVLDWLTLDFQKFIRFGSVRYVLEQFKAKRGNDDISEATLRQYVHPEQDDVDAVEFSEVPTVVLYDP